MSLLALMLIAAPPATCPPLPPATTAVLAVTSADPEFEGSRRGVQRRLRALARGRITFAPEATTRHAMSAEGGARDRAAALLDARVRLEGAEARFRDLDAEAALAQVADLISRLVYAHQAEGAPALLARAHLLAAAIYLARDEPEAVQARLFRALDLDPGITAPRDRFDPRLQAQLAAASAARALRPTGRLEVDADERGRTGEVFLDGHRLGSIPLSADAVPAGRHLLRVQADGARSEISSIRVRAGETTVRTVRLRRDPERTVMDELAQTLRAGTQADTTAALELLARRAGSEHAVVAELLLSPDRSAVGTATVAVRLWSSTGGAGWAPDTRAENLAVALGQALGCGRASWPSPRGPALLVDPRLATSAAPVPTPRAWWQAPWVWAIAAGLAIGTAGALVAARANSGPPDGVSITLIPRP